MDDLADEVEHLQLSQDALMVAMSDSTRGSLSQNNMDNDDELLQELEALVVEEESSSSKPDMAAVATIHGVDNGRSSSRRKTGSVRYCAIPMPRMKGM